MRTMRTLLLLILCLAIPLQGFAAMVALEPPCPMEATAAGSMDASDSMAHDCCNDADTVAKTGKLCKMGQECPSGGQYLLFPPVVLAVAPVTVDRFSLITHFIPTLSPAGLWRPPTQL